MKLNNALILVILMLCLVNVTYAAANATHVKTWGSDGNHGRVFPNSQTTIVMSGNTVSNNAVKMATSLGTTATTFTAVPTTGTCIDNTKKVAVYMPAITNSVYSESKSTYVNTAVAFDPMTTSMLFEYNPDYLGDSNIASKLTTSNYAVLIVPMCQMSSGAATAITNYIAAGGSVWFMNDPCMTTTGTSSVQLTSILGSGVSTSVNSNTISVVNTDSITSGLPASFKPLGTTAKTAEFRSLSGSGTKANMNYQVLMSSGSIALLIKFENPTNGARVIYSNPNMFISGGTSSYFNAQTATQLFMQTKAWIMKFAQNPNGVTVTYPGGDKQLTVSCDDEECSSWDVPITPMINAETALGITPSSVNTFFVIPSSDVTKSQLAYYSGYGDTHNLHPHLTVWDTTSVSTSTYDSDIAADKKIINTAAGVTDYGFTSWRFPMTTYCANSMQAVSDSGITVESSSGVDSPLAGTQNDNTILFPEQILVNNAKTNTIEFPIPAGFDIDYTTGTAFAAGYNAFSNQFKNVNFPANFVVSGHYQGIGTNCGVSGWGVTSTSLTSGLTSILSTQKAANPNYNTFNTLSTYLSGIRSAKVAATYDGTSTTLTVINSKAIKGFTLKAGLGSVESATCDGSSVSIKTDSTTGALYVTKDLAAGTHVFVLSNSVISTAPVASFTASTTNGTAPLQVTFTNTSTGSPTPSISWNFGDGNISSGSPVTYTFTNTGTTAIIRTVIMTATNSVGSSTSTTQITVNPTPAVVVKPIAAFTVSPTSGTTSTTFTFTDTSTNSPTTWSWDFGDGKTSSAKNVTHKYTTVKTYTVTLTATNTAGSSTVTKSVIVSAAKLPVASFTYLPTAVKKGATIKFTDTSTNIPNTWNWTFGDRSAAVTSQNPTHVFSKTGSFKVTLVVYNNVGSNTITKTITVS